LVCLAGGALLVTASCRLAFALVITGALLWVYSLTVLIAIPARSVFPRQGKNLVLVFLAAFVGSVYAFLITLASPVLGMELLFLISLVPLICVGSGLLERTAEMDMGEAVSRAFSEAGALGFFIVAFSLIREPLGFFSLSFPGGAQGIVQIFSSGREGFLPVFIVASSSGALLLLGYGVSLYRYFRSAHVSGEDKQ
jgi:hypothetical protein